MAWAYRYAAGSSSVRWCFSHSKELLLYRTISYRFEPIYESLAFFLSLELYRNKGRTRYDKVRIAKEHRCRCTCTVAFVLHFAALYSIQFNCIALHRRPRSGVKNSQQSLHLVQSLSYRSLVLFLSRHSLGVARCGAVM